MTEELLRLYAAEAERLKAVAAAAKADGEYLRPVFGAGNTSSPVLFIGEAPGANETEKGTPFVGKAGAQLDELLALSGIPRQEIFITNVVKFRPCVRSERSVRNRTPSAREILDSLPLLEAEIKVIAPKLIVTLGNTPLSAILTLAGEPPQTVGDLHGTAMTVCMGNTKTVLYPMYHPASGIYNRSLVEVMRADAINICHTVY